MSISARIRRPATVLVGAVVLLATAGGPASAERLGLEDPADVGGASLSDILAVTAIHAPKKVVVRVDFAELEPTSDGGPSSLSVFVDTDPGAKGPEFRVGAGLQEGTDYQLVRMAAWKPVGEPLTCSHAVRIDFDANRVRARISRDCLGNPATVRVGAKMTDLYDGSHPVVDWLGKRRYLSIPLASG
ncbi:hypothetical protein [Nocardioides sp.]|uniref:hypothetical protein n=1 Tax=Nocardioides sp. TaxID=35761 RepID=UPI001A2ACD5B|nr:hypothetical protein [Nocardioides sp.]MBJ7358337.1 hypothetical protein [Nocardioides sp.]